jgi:hypothetical protein
VPVLAIAAHIPEEEIGSSEVGMSNVAEILAGYDSLQAGQEAFSTGALVCGALAWLAPDGS